VINGENASYKAPKFMKPQVRTRNAIIDDIVSDFGKKSSDYDESNSSSPSYSPSPVYSLPRRGSFFTPGPLMRRISTNPNHENGADQLGDLDSYGMGSSATSATLGATGGIGIGGMFTKKLWSRKSKQNEPIDPLLVQKVSTSSDSVPGAEEDDVLMEPPPPNKGRKGSFFKR
jgi:hypothetical protein